MLLDMDTKPEETIFYLATKLNAKIKECQKCELVFIESLYQEIDVNQPYFKFNLALNFLFLIGKVKISGGDLIYVSE